MSAPRDQRVRSTIARSTSSSALDRGPALALEDADRAGDGLERRQPRVVGLDPQAIVRGLAGGQGDAGHLAQPRDAPAHLRGLAPGAVGDDQGTGR